MNLNRKLCTIILITLFSVTARVDAKEFSFLTLNSWNTSTHVKDGIGAFANIVDKLEPDVVAFQEVRYKKVPQWGSKLIKRLSDIGQKYNLGYVDGTDVCILTRFKIESSQAIFKYKNSAAKFALEVAKDKHITVVATHLDFQGYASNLARGYNCSTPKYKGWKVIDDGNGNPKPIKDSKVLLEESKKSSRLEQMRSILDSVKNDINPIIILGDFNEPSCLDWTEPTKNMFKHNGVVVEWPVTKLLDNNGFKDAYRVFYPNEIKNPGITWPSVFSGRKVTSWAPKSDDRDRVDYVFYKGKSIKPTNVALVGPIESYAFGKKTSENTENDIYVATDLVYPSDHKGVLATLDIKFNL